MKQYYEQWRKYTSDQYILNAVSGYRIELTQHVVQSRVPAPYKLKPDEQLAVGAEILRLIEKRVIEPAPERGGFFSNVFTRPKKDGGHRMILDLSDLNEFVKYAHFKMETFDMVTTLLTKGCYMLSIDLQDAYYSVPIALEHRKYLKFFWEGKAWQFKALPNGLSSGPRLFTKILKPLLSHLRSGGVNIIAYIDDTLILAKSREEAIHAMQKTVQLFTDLGFIVHPAKSVLQPTHEINFLGFTINSTTMQISLPQAKREEIKEICWELLNASPTTIKQLAVAIGKMVAAFPAVQYGPLYYRELEKDKIVALQKNQGHFDRPVVLSRLARNELSWWLKNIDHAFKQVDKGTPTMCITTDASGMGWGATNGNISIGGRWTTLESIRAVNNEINYLELLAIFLALKSFCSHLQNSHVLIRTDNTTALTYINKMGGIKSVACNALAITIWKWCGGRNLWLSASHLPGIHNLVADKSSRVFNDQLEWMLNRQVFCELCAIFGTPDIDLFASRLNAQLNRYISWKPDPGSESVDAFLVDWQPYFFYAFPPFSLVGKCLCKIEHDQAEGILIAPKWPTQPWFPKLLSLLVAEPIILPRTKFLLIQPSTGEPHPLNKHLLLMSCRLSGKNSRTKEFQTRLRTLSYHHGGTRPSANTRCTLNDGLTFAVNGRAIHCKQLPWK